MQGGRALAAGCQLKCAGDVFRAVAKALRHRHAKPLRRQRRHLAIGAIASAAGGCKPSRPMRAATRRQTRKGRGRPAARRPTSRPRAVDKTGAPRSALAQSWPASTAPASSQGSSAKCPVRVNMAGRTTRAPTPPAVRAGCARPARLARRQKTPSSPFPLRSGAQPGGGGRHGDKTRQASMRASQARMCG